MLFSGLSLDLDITYVLVLLLFFLPLLILNGIVFKPFMAMFEQRHEQLEGALMKAEGRIDEAEAKAEAFKEKMKAANAKGVEARDGIRADAQAAMQKRIDEERRRLDEKLQKALGEIEKQKDSSMGELQSQSQALAELTTSKLLGRQV